MSAVVAATNPAPSLPSQAPAVTLDDTKLQRINDPFEQAFFVMVHLPYLQPFEDVNKRVSRDSIDYSCPFA